jgi:hypothetical protein
MYLSALIKVRLVIIIKLGYLTVKPALSKLCAIELTYCVIYLKCAMLLLYTMFLPASVKKNVFGFRLLKVHS